MLVLSNCYIPTGLSFRELSSILEKVNFEKLIILGDFIDFPKRVSNQFIDSIEKKFHKFLNRIVRRGCKEIIYVVGDRDSIMLESISIFRRLFSTRVHITKVCSYHVESIHSKKIVFSHGHSQINIAISEALSPELSDKEILIEAARKARVKEELAGLRGILPKDAWWFIGHTNLLYIDSKGKIVHVGYLAKEPRIRGCGPLGDIVKPSRESRGFALVEECTVKLYRIDSKLEVAGMMYIT